MDDDLESIDHLSIDKRTIENEIEKVLMTDCQSTVNRSMIDETIIGYMEDGEHNDQDTCMIIIWWFGNYRNYLLGGVKCLFHPCWPVSLSLPSPSLWLSPCVPSSLRPHPPPPPPITSPLSLSVCLSVPLSLSLSLYTFSLYLLSYPPALFQHGKLGTRNMFVCLVPHIQKRYSSLHISIRYP